MKLGFAQCETVLKTLPIGYYAGRRVDTILDEKEVTSFYSPMEDKIVVSYPIIAHRAQAMPDNADAESAIRAMLYHEVSHAILTNGNELKATDINNIFEDERIETILKDYYMNTDFKQQLYDICGGTIPEARDEKEAFFNAVRFRCAPQNIQNEVTRIINEYAYLNRNVDDWYAWSRYRREINDLYEKVCKAFKKNPEQFQPQNQNGGSQGQGKQTSPDTMKSNQKNGQGEGEGEQQEENGNRCPVEAQESPLSQEEIRRMVGASFSSTPNINSEQQKQLADFTKTAETIINNFNKKNGGGSGVNAYSGVFNPRAVARKDYRYFERSMPTQGNNKFGTCHLNLFIDCSGSMQHNQNIVNGMLASLSEIERKNRNFSIDVSFINWNYRDCKTVRDRVFLAEGGNDIPKDMKERFLKRQTANTCNYNIVLFDGDALCNCHDNIAGKIQRFSAFDYKQTTLITDPYNQKYLGSGFTNTKVVVTYDYTKELLSHITKALTVAFG